jgi:hypothetical protein
MYFGPEPAPPRRRLSASLAFRRQLVGRPNPCLFNGLSKIDNDLSVFPFTEQQFVLKHLKSGVGGFRTGGVCRGGKKIAFIVCAEFNIFCMSLRLAVRGPLPERRWQADQPNRNVL